MFFKNIKAPNLLLFLEKILYSHISYWQVLSECKQITDLWIYYQCREENRHLALTLTLTRKLCPSKYFFCIYHCVEIIRNKIPDFPVSGSPICDKTFKILKQLFQINVWSDVEYFVKEFAKFSTKYTKMASLDVSCATFFVLFPNFE